MIIDYNRPRNWCVLIFFIARWYIEGSGYIGLTQWIVQEG